MDEVANLSADERRDLFEQTSKNRGMHAAIVEKDFWVCWVLKQLFSDDGLKGKLVFKGGTSLSKVFGLIERFSEDIDLILDWQLLGYGPGQDDPFQDFDSNARRHRFNQEFNRKAARYIAETLVPDMARLFSRCTDLSAAVDENEPQTVNIAYPAAFSLGYLRPEVRLEIGPLASWVPSHAHMIRPYAAEEFPQVFASPECSVVTIDAERTFWEKATILHQQAHRTATMPARYSRHYYDLCKLASSDVRRKALVNLGLLQDVTDFKQRFYPSRWARYEDAKPGTFKLLPTADRLAELKSDYVRMAEMIYGEVPPFEQIIDTLRQLEVEINGQNA